MRRAKEKDMSAIRRTIPFRHAIENQIKSADIKDQGGVAKVAVHWDLNKDAIRDRVFLMEINGEQAYIDLEELMSYTRLM